MSTYPRDVASYPFPLSADTYRISANVEPAAVARTTAAGSWGGHVLHVGDDHDDVLARRREILTREPGRFVAAPHARAASWDALLYLAGRLAAEYPDRYALDRDGDRYRFDGPGGTRKFTFGDDASLPSHPLRFAGEHVTEDVVVLGARDDRLWLDAGLVTFASVWSLAFDAGMTFRELHGPVPGNGPGGVFDRAERFLLTLRPGQAYRRLNWGLQADDRLDMSLDSWASWMPNRRDPTPGSRIHLRTEVQHLIRLPLTGSVLFLIGVRPLPLERVALVPEWSRRLLAVLETLPPEVAEYKELDALGALAVEYLRAAHGSSWRPTGDG